MSAIHGFRLQAGDVGHVGVDLSRPECVLAERDGTIWVSDDRAAFTRIAADGTQTRVGAIGGAPNGFAIDRSGALLLANIGDGRLYRVERDGHHEVLLEAFEGAPLGAPNFAYVDMDGCLWLTVSTRVAPRRRAIDEMIADGFVLRRDPDGWRRIAGGLRFTNEIRIDTARRWLYVVETAAGCVSRLPLAADGTAGAREAFGPEPLAEGAHTDGIAFDAEGNLWVTDVARNALFVIDPTGRATEVFRDPEGLVMPAPTSLAFAGPDRRTVLVGSLRATRLACFRSPVPGAPLAHDREPGPW